jgi:hypothetical protein
VYFIDRYYDPATDQFLSVDPDVAETGQPYVFTGDDPVNGSDPLGLYITGGGSSECNSSSGTLYCTGSTSSGQSVAGSYNPSTGATTGAFDDIPNPIRPPTVVKTIIATPCPGAATLQACDDYEKYVDAYLQQEQNDIVVQDLTKATECGPDGYSDLCHQPSVADVLLSAAGNVGYGFLEAGLGCVSTASAVAPAAAFFTPPGTVAIEAVSCVAGGIGAYFFGPSDDPNAYPLRHDN